MATIHVYLARVQLAEGNPQEAWMTLREADQIRRKDQLSPLLESSLEVEIVRMWLALQSAGMRLAASDPLAEESRLLLDSWRSKLAHREEDRDSHMDLRLETIFLILARASFISGQIDEALSLLEPVARNARSAGHHDVVIASSILLALAHQRKGTRDTGPMLRALEEALSLAEAGGHVRIFLNEGAPMQRLLAQWLAQAGTSPFREYVLRLLSQFKMEPHSVGTVRENAATAGKLVEPLSSRELEVLHLMALGSTNQEIAEQLIVAVGTVKAHAASIYRKLEAANRTEAVSRARKLGLLA